MLDLVNKEYMVEITLERYSELVAAEERLRILKGMLAATDRYDFEKLKNAFGIEEGNNGVTF